MHQLHHLFVILKTQQLTYLLALQCCSSLSAEELQRLSSNFATVPQLRKCLGEAFDVVLCLLTNAVQKLDLREASKHLGQKCFHQSSVP